MQHRRKQVEVDLDAEHRGGPDRGRNIGSETLDPTGHGVSDTGRQVVAGARSKLEQEQRIAATALEQRSGPLSAHQPRDRVERQRPQLDPLVGARLDRRTRAPRDHDQTPRPLASHRVAEGQRHRIGVLHVVQHQRNASRTRELVETTHQFGEERGLADRGVDHRRRPSNGRGQDGVFGDERVEHRLQREISAELVALCPEHGDRCLGDPRVEERRLADARVADHLHGPHAPLPDVTGRRAKPVQFRGATNQRCRSRRRTRHRFGKEDLVMHRFGLGSRVDAQLLNEVLPHSPIERQRGRRPAARREGFHGDAQRDLIERIDVEGPLRVRGRGRRIARRPRSFGEDQPDATTEPLARRSFALDPRALVIRQQRAAHDVERGMGGRARRRKLSGVESLDRLGRARLELDDVEPVGEEGPSGLGPDQAAGTE